MSIHSKFRDFRPDLGQVQCPIHIVPAATGPSQGLFAPVLLEQHIVLFVQKCTVHHRIPYTPKWQGLHLGHKAWINFPNEIVGKIIWDPNPLCQVFCLYTGSSTIPSRGSGQPMDSSTTACILKFMMATSLAQEKTNTVQRKRGVYPLSLMLCWLCAPLLNNIKHMHLLLTAPSHSYRRIIRQMRWYDMIWDMSCDIWYMLHYICYMIWRPAIRSQW